MQEIEEILSFLSAKDVNIKNLSTIIGISTDRLYSWRNGRGRPKAEDTEKLLHWWRNRKENANKVEEIQTLDPSSDTYKDKYIALLEKLLKENDERAKNLVRINTEVTESVQANLKTVLENQLTLTCLFESFVKSFSELMIEQAQDQHTFRLRLHKEAFERVSDLMKTGKHVKIDSVDIASDGA